MPLSFPFRPSPSIDEHSEVVFLTEAIHLHVRWVKYCGYRVCVSVCLCRHYKTFNLSFLVNTCHSERFRGEFIHKEALHKCTVLISINK